ncbi:Neurotrypsin, partial [Desmophyllum pertusum]
MSSCQEVFPLRFRVEKIPSLGMMEIYKNSTWQKLCTRSWDKDEEHLTCKTMVTLTMVFMIMAHVPVRLNGANIDDGGRVEVFYKGKWGKDLPNKWDFNDVKVICRQLGFKGALAEFIGSDVKDEGNPFVMSGVTCTGGEPELASCARIDGKLNIDCQKDDKGAEALCEPIFDELINFSYRPIRNFCKGGTYQRHQRFATGTSEMRVQSRERLQGTLETYKSRNALHSTLQVRRRVRAPVKSMESVNDATGLYIPTMSEYAKYYIVYVNARFTKETPQQSLIADTSGIISCSAEGTPTPQIIWRKARWSTDFTQETVGTYICTMKQSKGTVRITSKDQTIDVSVI